MTHPQDDSVVKVAPVLECTGDFATFLGKPFNEAETYSVLRRAETTGRPIGAAGWLKALEEKNGRPSQRVDHVWVTSEGKAIGRDGKPISGRVTEDAENSHIPLSEY